MTDILYLLKSLTNGRLFEFLLARPFSCGSYIYGPFLAKYYYLCYTYILTMPLRTFGLLKLIIVLFPCGQRVPE